MGKIEVVKLLITIESALRNPFISNELREDLVKKQNKWNNRLALMEKCPLSG